MRSLRLLPDRRAAVIPVTSVLQALSHVQHGKQVELQDASTGAGGLVPDTGAAELRTEALDRADDAVVQDWVGAILASVVAAHDGVKLHEVAGDAGDAIITEELVKERGPPPSPSTVEGVIGESALADVDEEEVVCKLVVRAHAEAAAPPGDGRTATSELDDLPGISIVAEEEVPDRVEPGEVAGFEGMTRFVRREEVLFDESEAAQKPGKRAKKSRQRKGQTRGVVTPMGTRSCCHTAFSIRQLRQ